MGQIPLAMSLSRETQSCLPCVAHQEVKLHPPMPCSTASNDSHEDHDLLDVPAATPLFTHPPSLVLHHLLPVSPPILHHLSSVIHPPFLFACLPFLFAYLPFLFACSPLLFACPPFLFAHPPALFTQLSSLILLPLLLILLPLLLVCRPCCLSAALVTCLLPPSLVCRPHRLSAALVTCPLPLLPVHCPHCLSTHPLFPSSLVHHSTSLPVLVFLPLSLVNLPSLPIMLYIVVN